MIFHWRKEKPLINFEHIVEHHIFLLSPFLVVRMYTPVQNIHTIKEGENERFYIYALYTNVLIKDSHHPLLPSHRLLSGGSNWREWSSRGNLLKGMKFRSTSVTEQTASVTTNSCRFCLLFDIRLTQTWTSWKHWLRSPFTVFPRI